MTKVQVENATIILITPAWQAQPLYPKALQMSIHNPVLISKRNNLLLGPDFLPQSLVESRTLQLPSGLGSFREKLFAEGLSEKAASLISDARGSVTVNCYEKVG